MLIPQKKKGNFEFEMNDLAFRTKECPDEYPKY